MEAHDQILHGLLDMGQMLLLCGAEINRVEDTMTRLGRAYGAKKIDIFAITSDIVLTILFEDGVELTQTRRINKASSFDFVKLERLNALSRRICTEPVSAAEFRAELKKIDRVIDREFPEAERKNLLVLDATTGQNALTQAELFDEAIDLDGIILTKLDGTAKGGVVFAIKSELDMPVYFVGVGEGIDDLLKFDAQSFIDGIV